MLEAHSRHSASPRRWNRPGWPKCFGRFLKLRWSQAAFCIMTPNLRRSFSSSSYYEKLLNIIMDIGPASATTEVTLTAS